MSNVDKLRGRDYVIPARPASNCRRLALLAPFVAGLLASASCNNAQDSFSPSVAAEVDPPSVTTPAKNTDVGVSCRMLSEVNDALRLAARRCRLSARTQTSWEMIHASLAFGLEHEIGDGTGGVLTIGDYFFDRPESVKLFERSAEGFRFRRHPIAGQMEQHRFQFLGYFAQLEVSHGQPIRIGETECILADFIDVLKQELDVDDETSAYGLMAASQYISPDDTWHNQFGREMSLALLLDHEVSIPMDVRRSKTPCSGAHSFFAVAFCIRGPKQKSRFVAPLVDRAQDLLRDERDRLCSLQMPNGSFSADRDNGSLQTSLQTTGHALEWILLAADNVDLGSECVINAVRFITRAIVDRAGEPMSAGPWFHAIHAIQLYRDRIAAVAGCGD